MPPATLEALRGSLQLLWENASALPHVAIEQPDSVFLHPHHEMVIPEPPEPPRVASEER